MVENLLNLNLLVCASMCVMFLTMFYLCHDFCRRGTRLNLEGKIVLWLHLFICPLVKPFNPETFSDVCEHFHSYYSRVLRMILLLHHFLVHSKFHLFIKMISGNLNGTLWWGITSDLEELCFPHVVHEIDLLNWMNLPIF
jgi:hypothetical protein